jgi:hypothetical protein
MTTQCLAGWLGVSYSVKNANHAAPIGGWIDDRPNPPLNSDPACIAFRSLSAFRYPGSARRLGAGGAG